eukprot:gene57959-biopygen41591
MNLNGTTMNKTIMKKGTGSNNPGLTHTELDCLRLVANGLRGIEIAGELKVDEQEINQILLSAENKLNARNRLHAIGIAVSHGLIGMDGK